MVDIPLGETQILNFPIQYLKELVIIQLQNGYFLNKTHKTQEKELGCLFFYAFR